MAIAKMSRVFMVGPSVHKEETLRFLQNAGVVHLEPVQPLAGAGEKESSAALLRLRRIGQIEEAVNRFSRREKRHPVDCPDEDLVRCAEEALATLEKAGDRRQTLESLADDLAPWGDFDPDVLRCLEEAGASVGRWRMDRKKGADLIIPDGVFSEIVAEKREYLFYTISLAGLVDIPGASALPLPEMSLSRTLREIERLKTEEESLADRLAGIALRADILKKQMAAALNEACYLEQMGTLYAEDYLFGLQGWIPDDHINDFLGQIEKEHLPLQCEVRAPLPEEEPPVLLKNNWFVRRIEPLLKLYDIPQYSKRDPSYFFAPFMVLFFGICLADAGYGLVFYLVSHFIGRKLGDKVDGLPLIVKLCKALAVSSVVVGLLTGSVFGYHFEDRRWILLDVSVGAGKPMVLFYIALGLGVLHLSISYMMGIMQAPRRYIQITKLGLLFVLWGGVLLAVRSIWFNLPSTVLNTPLYYAGLGVLVLGILLTLFYSSNDWRWHIRLGAGLWHVYGLTGLIGDLLSYARLFGLGIGSAAIAEVMNQLAVMVMGAAGPVIGLPLAVIIIILGHTFNIALGILSSTIHSARLHFVETFKSFYEGGGIEYKPFKMEGGKL